MKADHGTTSPARSDAGSCSRALTNEQRRNRKLVPFRNCFCGVQAVKVRDGTFLCLRHWQFDKLRLLQDPRETAMNIRRSNIESEKRRYARLKGEGMCVTCGKAWASKTSVRCEPCQAKRRAWRGKKMEGAHPWKTR